MSMMFKMKEKEINPIFFNAIDSLKVGMQFFLEAKSPTANKHAILAIFHSIELFLKEFLYRVHPILIYKNIDARIAEDSSTVGINEIIFRLTNLNIGLPKEEQEIIRRIQKRRNRIEHHTYALEDTDPFVIGEALKFVQYFVESQLHEKLHRFVSHDLMNKIEKTIFNYQEIAALAQQRITHFLLKVFPEWKPEENELPAQFPGALDCPICTNHFLVVDFIANPFCFYCNKQIENPTPLHSKQ